MVAAERNKKGNKRFDFIHYHSVVGLCVTDIQDVPALLLTGNGYSLQLECIVLISWLHIISSAWLTHFLFAPSTSLTQHSDHTMNLLMLRSQSTYELSSQFVGIKDGNVMIQHLQR